MAWGLFRQKNCCNLRRVHLTCLPPSGFTNLHCTVSSVTETTPSLFLVFRLFHTEGQSQAFLLNSGQEKKFPLIEVQLLNSKLHRSKALNIMSSDKAPPQSVQRYSHHSRSSGFSFTVQPCTIHWSLANTALSYALSIRFAYIFEDHFCWVKFIVRILLPHSRNLSHLSFYAL